MTPRSTLALLALATIPAAQGVSGQFSPDPAPVGAPIALTVTEALGTGVNLSSGCTWLEIRAFAQDGPLVQHLPPGSGCGAAIVPIAPHGTFGFTWDQFNHDTGLPVPPGEYWWRVRYLDAGLTGFHTEWFCHTIVGAGAVVLTAGAPAKAGTVVPLSIAAPTEPGAFYAVACSATSNSPTPLAPGVSLCVDMDAIFALTIPTPAPGLFAGFQGFLDGLGNASGISIAIPASPTLHHQPLKVQAALVGGPGGLRLSNTLSFTIEP